jgi:fucose permease
LLIKNKAVWVLALLMICAGAAEQAMAQWASAFAESALGVDKTIGDMAGACLFVFCMAISRTLYAVMSEKINLPKFIIGCSFLAVGTYALAVFSPLQWMSLVACGLCGFAVGMMWPGTLSIAADVIGGSTALFAMYAVFGDIGATIGPTIVGFVSGAFNDDLKKGLACIIIFPVIIIIGMMLTFRKKDKNQPLSKKKGE